MLVVRQRNPERWFSEFADTKSGIFVPRGDARHVIQSVSGWAVDYDLRPVFGGSLNRQPSAEQIVGGNLGLGFWCIHSSISRCFHSQRSCRSQFKQEGDGVKHFSPHLCGGLPEWYFWQISSH